MTRPEWLVRSVRKTQKDRTRLETFTCADRLVPWQVEVEDFVRNQLFDWRYAPLARENDPRLLLMLHRPTQDLIGVVAHERLLLQAEDGSFPATKLEVVAIATAWQGRSFAAGHRVSDVLMSAAMTDVRARVPSRFARVLALVHEDNVRSLSLCRRHGFIEELSRAEKLQHYFRLITGHQTRED